MITRKRCPLCMHEDRSQLEADLEAMSYSADALDQQMNWKSGTTSRHQRNHMGAYVESANPSCKICSHPMRAELEEQIHSGEMSPLTASRIVECTEDQVVRHVDKHLKPIVQKSAANMIAKKEIDEIESLTANIQRLEVKIDSLFSEDSTDPKYIDSLTKLAKEIRESLKYSLEFKGKLVHKRQDTIIVHQMQVIKEVLAQNHPDVWLDVRSKMEEKLQ